VTIEHRVGDLFSSEGLDALAHGCNCAGAMGRGIAVEFKNRWPAMYSAYRERCRNGVFNPGDAFVWEESGLTLYNLGTQAHWRKAAELWAIEAAVQRMIEHAIDNGISVIGMPRIGSGLGGLPWGDVEQVIREVLGDVDIRIIVHSV
jgi:O-acetyl-ADP-ribose deacetylase (regulator of RNase III)